MRRWLAALACSGWVATASASLGGCATGGVSRTLHDQLESAASSSFVPPPPPPPPAGADARADAVQAEQDAVIVRARVGAVKRQGQRTLLKPGCTITFIEVDGPIGDYPQISSGLRSAPVASPECL